MTVSPDLSRDPNATPAARPPETPQSRGLPGIVIAGIAVGAVLVAALLFGGGVALGLALPVGNPGVGTSQGGYPGGPGGQQGENGTRPSAPHGDSNRSDPTAPNTDDTETQDDTQED